MLSMGFDAVPLGHLIKQCINLKNIKIYNEKIIYALLSIKKGSRLEWPW
jgi:hypothetical protein